MAEKVEKENEFIIDYNNNKLRLKFNNINNQSIKISIQDFINAPNYYYENSFNINGLFKKSKVLKACNDIEEILNHFIYLIKTNQYLITKINENEYDLIFRISFFFEINDVFFELYKISA